MAVIKGAKIKLCTGNDAPFSPQEKAETEICLPDHCVHSAHVIMQPGQTQPSPNSESCHLSGLFSLITAMATPVIGDVQFFCAFI